MPREPPEKSRSSTATWARSTCLCDSAGRATHAVFSAPGLALVAGIDDPGAGLARVASQTAAVVAVTLGADGLLWLEGETERRVAAPRIDAVDTLAAGDVWHGAFTLALGGRRRNPFGGAFRQCRRSLEVHAVGRPQRRAGTCRSHRIAIGRLVIYSIKTSRLG